MTGELLQLMQAVTATQSAAQPDTPLRPARAAPASDDAAKEPDAAKAAGQPGVSGAQKHESQSPAAAPARSTRLQIVIGSEGVEQVKVLDTATDKVVLEVPPEELVEFAKRMDQYIGLLFDRVA